MVFHADGFHPEFAHRFDLALAANVGVTAFQGPELPLAGDLKAAAIVVADAAGAGLEDGVLHRFGMLFGDVETKLVDGHRASLADRPGSGGLAVVVGGLGQVRVSVAQLIVALG